MSRLTAIAVYCPWARPHISEHSYIVMEMNRHIRRLMRCDL